MGELPQDTLVELLKRGGLLRDPAVEGAFRTVPRHRFVPHLTLDEAYADHALAVLERGGRVVSSCSQPSMIARMLDLLDVHPGQRILEIGTGTGYNAALLAHLTGSSGGVVTLDIEPDLTTSARAAFDDIGVRNILALLADGRNGAASHAPFDRIIVTAATDDIAPAWIEQLTIGGRLVAPLAFTDGQWAMGFIREPGGLRSIGATACAFVPLRSHGD